MSLVENLAKHERKMTTGNFLHNDVAGAFNAGFLDEVARRHWILNAVHCGQDISCPQCTAPLTRKNILRFSLAKRIRCHACGKFFTALTGTFLQGCHLSFRQIILLAVFLHFGIRPATIADKVGVSEETVRLWQKKFSALKILQTRKDENGPE